MLNITITPPSSSTSSYFYNTEEFNLLSPINISLAVYIMIQNSMVIYHYHKDCRKISSLLFTMIAVVDIGQAFVEIGRGSLALLCSRNKTLQLQPWTYLTSLLLGHLFFVVSTYLCVVLTVVKTVKIVNPFHVLNNRAIYVNLFIFPLLYLLLCISDNWCWNDLLNFRKFKCTSEFGLFGFYFTINTIGQGIGFWFEARRYISDDTFILDSAIIDISLLTVQFCLPCFIVLICLILQMIYIKKTLGATEAASEQDTANHVNITVFLISMLYLISISLFSFRVLVADVQIILNVERPFKLPFIFEMMMIAKFTLPLLNAALFPTILILRKPELRARFKDYVRFLVILPFYLVLKVHRVCRRVDYSEI